MSETKAPTQEPTKNPLIPKEEKTKFLNISIDVVGYVGGNFLANAILDTPEPKVLDTVAFLISEIIMRFGPEVFRILEYNFPDFEKKYPDLARNMDIYVWTAALASFATFFKKGQYSILTPKKILIKSLIGFAVNTAIDASDIFKEYK